jgi:hypothetical protein
MFQRWIVVAALVLVGVSFLTADEPKPRAQRVSPSLLKEALSSPLVATAAAVPSLGRTIEDLRALTADLEKGGHRDEANRLNAAIKNIVRDAERQLAEKKQQLTQLQGEVEELNWAAGR